MKEYIEREAALKAAWHNYYPSIDHYTVSVKCTTRKDIEEIPAADVRKVVRGKWIRCNGGAGFKCSVCKARHSHADVLNGNHNYCYKCGADMRGEEDEN